MQTWSGFNLWVWLLKCVCCVFESTLLTGGVCVSVPLLASRLRMLLSDICRRAVIGGTLDSVAGSRVTSAFMSLSSSSNWFNTEMPANINDDWLVMGRDLVLHFQSFFWASFFSIGNLIDRTKLFLFPSKGQVTGAEPYSTSDSISIHVISTQFKYNLPSVYKPQLKRIFEAC